MHPPAGQNYGLRIKSSSAIKLDFNGQNITALTGIDNTNTSGLVLSNSGAGTAGTVALSATNSYTGGTTVGDKVRVNLTNNSGLSSGAVTVNSGGQVYLNNGATNVTNSFTLNGAGWGGDATPLGALRMSNASSITSSSTVTLASASTIAVDNSGTATINGKITGGGNLTVNTSASSGKLILTNSSNDYSGTTTVAAGTLALSGTGSIASSTGIELTVAGSKLDVTGLTSYTLGTNQILSGHGSLVATGKTVLASGRMSAGIGGGSWQAHRGCRHLVIRRQFEVYL